MGFGDSAPTSEKMISKEELTSLMQKYSLSASLFNKTPGASMRDTAMQPLTWNAMNGVLVFTNENGSTFFRPANQSIMEKLWASTDYKKDDSIGVPHLSSLPELWENNAKEHAQWEQWEKMA